MKQSALVITSILIIGVGLRLITLNAGIDLDDTITVFVASSSSMQEVLDKTAAYEFGPPLYFLLMSLWIKAFGASINSLAISSIITGSLLIPAVYLLAGETLTDKRAAYLAAFFAAVSPLAIFFSHETRPYSLLALLSTLTILSFIRAQRNNSQKELLLFFIATVALLYTHYLGIFLIGLLLLSPIITGQFKIQIYGTVCLAIICLFPWWPKLVSHLSHGTYWVDPTPLARWPEVIASNLAATLPLPWIAGYIFLIVLFPVVLIVAIIKAIKNTGLRQLPVKLQKLQASVATPVKVLTIIYVVPIAVLGFLTPFILGYCRYMLPFAIPGWILISAIVCPRFKNKTIVILALICLTAASAFETSKIASTSRNGMRAIAADIKANKFENCAFLIVPDYDSYTLIYYLEKEQKTEIPDKYLTFGRPNQLEPAAHKDYAKVFQKSDLLKSTLAEIAAIDKSRYQCLVLIHDPNVLNSRKMPAKSVCLKLIEEVKKRYHEAEPVRHYQSAGRSFDLYKFTLGEKTSLDRE